MKEWHVYSATGSLRVLQDSLNRLEDGKHVVFAVMPAPAERIATKLGWTIISYKEIEE